MNWLPQGMTAKLWYFAKINRLYTPIRKNWRKRKFTKWQCDLS